MSYIEKLRDPRWQRKRLEVMEDAGFSCENCGNDEITLNVHHLIYRKGKSPWEYERNELQCLCEVCHKLKHSLEDRLKIALSARADIIEIVVGFAESLALDGPEKQSIKVDSFEQAVGVAAALGHNNPHIVIDALVDGELSAESYLQLAK